MLKGCSWNGIKVTLLCTCIIEQQYNAYVLTCMYIDKYFGGAFAATCICSFYINMLIQYQQVTLLKFSREGSQRSKYHHFTMTVVGLLFFWSSQIGDKAYETHFHWTLV